MANLKGFPPSSTISPSVRVTEKDLSFVLASQSFHRAGIIGFASKGPINVPTVVRTRRELNRIFGYPHPDVSDPYLIYAAEQYLLVANELFVVRIADEDAVSDEAATTAQVEVEAAGGKISVISDTAETYSFDQDSFFRWRLNGISASKTLVVLADDNRASPDTGSAYTCEELATELNDQLVAEDGISFFCTSDDRIGVSTTFAYGPDASLEFVSVQNAIYGGAVIDGNPTGLGTSMTQASSTGDQDRYPDDGYQSAGTWDLSGLDDDGANLHVVIDGTDNVLIDNVVQVIDLSDLVGGSTTTSAIVNEINSQINASDIPGGFVAEATGDNLTFTTLHHGRDARILVKSDSPGFAVFGFDGVTGKGTSPEGVATSASVETFGIITGASNSTNEITFTVTAETPGIEGNNTEVRITNDVREGVFNIEVYNNGAQLESWGNLTKDASSRFYAPTYLAAVSDFIRVEDNTDVFAPPLASTAEATGTFVLAGGSDGIPADPDDQDALIIGNNLGFTGIYALSESEQYDIDLIAVPGHSSTDVISALISVAAQRGDCLAIVDPPFGLTVNEIVQWQNGTHPLNTTRFDSDYAALYWPWVKIRDTYNQVDVWIPPSGAVMATIARSDQLSEPWFAPAGEQRGVVPTITDVYSRPSQDERDLMYSSRNCINPIIQFADSDGFVIWGNKTMQRRPTALDRINVRRLLFIIEKRIKRESRRLLFDPHDDIFRRKFIDIATGILREVQIGRGLLEFIIQADDELNPSDVIDRNEFRAKIGIQPTHAVEFMFLEFSVHRTGSFAETSDTF